MPRLLLLILFSLIVIQCTKSPISEGASEQSREQHVYNDDGSYYTKLGGQGKGPGEYGHVFGLEAKASKVFVLDFTSQRLNEYSTKDYSLVRTIPLEQWKSGGESGYVEARNDILLNQYAQ